MSNSITAADIVVALEKRFDDSRQYVTATEVSNGTGGQIRRRIDMVVVNCYESNGQAIEGIEIKISKADLRTELRKPEKHECFYENLDYFSLATTKEVLEGMSDLIPKKWGIYVISEDGSTRARRKPLALHDEIKDTVSRAFNTSLVRAIYGRSLTEQYLNKIRKEEYERGRAFEQNRNDRAHEINHLKEQLARYELFDKHCGYIGSTEEDIIRTAKTYKAITGWQGIVGKSELEHAIKYISKAIEELEKLEGRDD